MTKKFFDHAYGLDDQAKVDAFYDEWAASYDDEVNEYGYASPTRCAQALAQFADLRAPILDFGCGTGLSGVALAHVGFQTIDGVEINDHMLTRAAQRDVYRDLRPGHIEQPFDFKVGTYHAIAAVGVISHGAGPADLLPLALASLAKDGLICFSYNDHTLEDSAYLDVLNQMIDQGIAFKEFEEYGAHLPAKRVNAMVYVLRRR